MFELVKNILKKSYILCEFGPINSHQWLTNPLFASICSDYRIIMQDPSRYAHKLGDLIDSLDRQLADNGAASDEGADNGIDDDAGGTPTDSNKSPIVFISYAWSNSHAAVAKGTKATKTSLGWLDPRSLRKFFRGHGIRVWLDTHDANGAAGDTSGGGSESGGGSGTGLFGEITKGLNKAGVFVACISDEYVKSTNCSLELRFAHVSLHLPIIKAVVGTGNAWRRHEMAFIAGDANEINFQYENKSKSLVVQNVLFFFFISNEKITSL